MGTERRDRRRQLHDARTRREGGGLGQDRQDLRARYSRRLQDPRLPAARLQDHRRAARPGRHSRPWTEQDHLQRRHHRGLGRRRQPARRPRPYRRRARLLQRQQAARFRRSHWAEEARRRESPADGDTRRAARHGRSLRHRRGQGRHRLQRQGDRGSRQEAGRRNPPGRRRDLPYRLAQPDRQGRQALSVPANPASASKAPSISPARAWSPSAPTPGASK